MNCPLCSTPLLFGAVSCPCGYNLATAPGEELPIELSYWESLRAYWRVYWPTQTVGLLLVFPIQMFPELLGTGLLLVAVEFVFGWVSLFLFVPRISSRPYRGFSLAVVALDSGATTGKLRMGQRTQIAFFLWWRQMLAGGFAALLAMPLNSLLAIMGLKVAPWVAMLAVVLVVGPILLKMLIGHQFDEFRLEARRERSKASTAAQLGVPPIAAG
jgi:hypothetical protein